jgi:PAS domain S-box-containing protein
MKNVWLTRAERVASAHRRRPQRQLRGIPAISTALRHLTGGPPVMTARELLEIALAQEVEHAIILLDGDGRVVSWLAGATRALGYTADEMLGQTLERIFTPEDRERGDLDWELRAARSYGKAEDDRWQVRKDGVRIWVSGIMTALRDTNDHIVGFSKILRDRTDIRSRLETLQARIDQASHAENEKHVVLGTLAHELRNPLGPLTNAAQMIGVIASDKPQISSCVQIIERQVRFIEMLVQDLLEATRVGVGKMKLHYESVDLRAAIANAIETCSAVLTDRRQSVEVLMPDALRLDADAIRLQQVIVNLITNSSKFSPPGSGIWIKATVDEDELVLRIEDHGKGIPPELLPRIFDLFTQAGSEGDSAGQGLGLGLGLVKSIVELHGGTVQARSEGDGRGAEMIVRLPLRQPAARDTAQ